MVPLRGGANDRGSPSRCAPVAATEKKKSCSQREIKPGFINTLQYCKVVVFWTGPFFAPPEIKTLERLGVTERGDCITPDH